MSLFNINDLVWAKMKGFPPWPGRVSMPTPELGKKQKKNCKCIFFYGSNNYAWIEVGCLKPYFEFKEALSYSCKTPNFKEAVKAIETYVIENKEATSNGTADVDSRFECLVNNITPTLQPETSRSMNSSAPIPKKAKKRSSKPAESTSNGPKKNKPKKPRLNPVVIEVEETDEMDSDNNSSTFFTNIGLTNNISIPLRKTNTSTLLDRPQVSSAVSVQLDVSKVSQFLKLRQVIPSNLKFGFLGLGNMGSGIVKNLLHSGHQVTVWNRTSSKSQHFEEIGALVGLTPSDVIGGSDVTFSCVSDPNVAKEMVFGNCGVLPEICSSKGYIEMTSIDPETSQDIHDAITGRGGRYLEAMIQGNKLDAENGTLVCLLAGDSSLFRDCKSTFDAISKKTTFISDDVGAATKMNLILHSIKAVSLAGLAECMALASRAEISQTIMLETLSLTSLNCQLLLEKGQAMMDNNFKTDQALKHLQKDLSLSLNWSDHIEQSCPIMASVNEVFKHAKRLGYSDHDTSSVYLRAKF